MGSCIYHQVPVSVKGKPITIVNETLQRETAMINSPQSTFTLQRVDPRNSKSKDKTKDSNKEPKKENNQTSKDIAIEIKETTSSSIDVLSLLADYQKKHQKPQAIYLKDYIINPLKDYMLCKVCIDILISPKQCSKCNLLMCSHCYEKTKEVICQHIQSDMNSDSILKKIELSLENENFKCFNWMNKCNEMSSYNNYTYDNENSRVISSHEKYCKFSPSKCTNPNCDYKGDFKDYKEHMLTCSFSQYECFYCKQIIKRSEIKGHQCFQSRSSHNILRLYYCRCGEKCDWIESDQNDNYVACNNSPNCIHVFYYKCPKCKELKCKYHYPIQISKVCGCGHRLTGGILKECTLCGVKGGIGWSCYACKRGIGLCEDCISQI